MKTSQYLKCILVDCLRLYLAPLVGAVNGAAKGAFTEWMRVRAEMKASWLAYCQSTGKAKPKVARARAGAAAEVTEPAGEGNS